MANKYISNPSRVGGQTRIPSIRYKNQDGTEQIAASNGEKSRVLADTFFLPKPAESTMPTDVAYPERVDYTCNFTHKQLTRAIGKLKPFKAPGVDGSPNIVLKETHEIIAEYLLQIFQAVFKLNTYSG